MKLPTLCKCGCGRPLSAKTLARYRFPSYLARVKNPGFLHGHQLEYGRSLLQRGERAAGWKGGRRKTGAGYVYLYAPDHPDATKSGYVMEHRIVMERELGRRLLRTEHVHHRNGRKADNRVENLVVLSRSEHLRGHTLGNQRGVQNLVRGSTENTLKGWRTRRARAK